MTASRVNRPATQSQRLTVVDVAYAANASAVIAVSGKSTSTIVRLVQTELIEREIGDAHGQYLKNNWWFDDFLEKDVNKDNRFFEELRNLLRDYGVACTCHVIETYAHRTKGCTKYLTELVRGEIEILQRNCICRKIRTGNTSTSKIQTSPNRRGGQSSYKKTNAP